MNFVKNLFASSNSSEYDGQVAKKFDDPIPNAVFVYFYKIEESKDNEQDDAKNNSQRISIFVINDKLGTVSMKADDSRTIEQLKKKLNEKFTFLHVDSLCIKYNNRVLSNSQTLRSVGTQNSSILHLIVYDPTKPVPITVRTNGAGKSNESESKPNSKNNDQTEDINLNANYMDTISDLIDRISKELKCNRLDLILKHNNRILDESGSIIEHGIKSNDVLDIVNIHQEIRVNDGADKGVADAVFDHIPKLDIRHPTGKIIKLKYDENCFIEDIKKMIEKIYSVNVKNQILMYNEIELSNTRMISYYKIEPESVLRLGFNLDDDNVKNGNQNGASDKEELIKILVKTLAGRTVMLEMRSNATVEELKQKIFESQNVKVEQQSIVFAGKQIKNSSSLSACGIKDESSVMLVLNVTGGKNKLFSAVGGIFQSIVGAGGGNGMCVVVVVVVVVCPCMSFDFEQKKEKKRKSDESKNEQNVDAGCWDNIWIEGTLHSIEWTAENTAGSWTYGDFKNYCLKELKIKDPRNLRIVTNGHEIVVGDDKALLQNINCFLQNHTIYVENAAYESQSLKNYPIIIIDESNTTNHTLEDILHVNKYFTIAQVKNELRLRHKYYLQQSLHNVGNRRSVYKTQAEAGVVHLIHNGRYLHNDETIESYQIRRNDKILAVSSKYGGNLLQFMAWLTRNDFEENADGKGKNKHNRKASSMRLGAINASQITVSDLQQSLIAAKIHGDEKLIRHVIKQGQKKIDDLRIGYNGAKTHGGKMTPEEKKALQYLGCFAVLKDSAAVAIYLWTTNLLHKQVNRALDTEMEQNLKPFKLYLNLLDYGLRHLPYALQTTGYRAFCGMTDLSGYSKGNVVCWKRITSFFKDKKAAMKYMRNNKQKPKALFEVTIIDGRDISPLCQASQDSNNNSGKDDEKGGDELKQILCLPFSHFKVLDVKFVGEKNQEQYIHILLKQVQTPRRGKVVVWADDNPDNNLAWIYDLEKKGISVIVCQTTNEAITILQTYKWILKLKDTSIRIVTDMKRYDNPTAGIDLIKALRKKYHFMNDVLIFTGHEKWTREHCVKNNITKNVYVGVHNDTIAKFLSFQPVDQKYTFKD